MPTCPTCSRVWRARSPIDALEDLAEALADFADTADLTAWLATH